MTTRMIRNLVAAILAGLLGALFCPANVYGVDTPEYWAQINKDGNWRNSNARSIVGNLRSRWAVALRNFTLIDSQAGQRSNNFAVRDGRILLIVPSNAGGGSPNNGNEGNYATYGTFALTNGTLIQSVLSPQQGGGGLMVPAGIMDSDTATGLVNLYWQAGGEVFTGQGSDHSGYWHFSAYNGEVPFGSPGASWLMSGQNSCGYFARSNSNPLLYARGGGGHTSYGFGIGGLLGVGGTQLTSLSMYNSYVADGNRIYSLFVTNTGGGTAPLGYGVQIIATEFQASPFSATNKWTYTDANKAFLNFGAMHCQGAPRAFCLGEDGRLYYYGYNTQGSGTTQTPNFAQGVLLAGIQSSNGTCDLNVPINYNPETESGSTTGASLARSLFPQIATLGNAVVVFQPQQLVNGHIFCVDTVTKALTWRFNFPAGYFHSATASALSMRGVTSPEQAVQVVIAGDSAYVAEAYADTGILKVRVDRFALSGGTRTTTVISPLDKNGQLITVAANATMAMRDIAAVDGTLVCLVDIASNVNLSSLYAQVDQALVVIEGDANPVLKFAPVAVISRPITGDPLTMEYSDYPVVPTNQFDSGTPIAFSSVGSMDPNGGAALTYLWNFGDGTTSTLANPTHSYASLGSPPTVTNRTVTLSVTNSVGYSNSATRLLAIRDVGSVQTLVYSAVADSWVDQWINDANINYGTAAQMQVTSYAYSTPGLLQHAYVQFDLMSVVPSNIVNATLRLWVTPGSGSGASMINTLFARACGNSWTETGITWNNAPIQGNIVGVKNFPHYDSSHGYFVDIPVTQYVKSVGADGLLSFELELMDVTSVSLMSLGTKEGALPAQLLIQMGDPGYTAPTIVTQPPDTSGNTLSILGASPLGEPALSYNWQLVSGSGHLTFSPNNSNSAKNTTMTFGGTGPFVVQCIVSDGLQSAVSRLVAVHPAPSGVATYVTTDTTTQGNWKSTYGTDGYAIQADSTNYPAYASVAFANNSLYTWAASTTDVRALQKAASSTDRIAACWYNNPSFTIDVNITDGQTHRVALYCLDWDTTARAQTFEIDDAVLGGVLDGPRSLSGFNGGQYVVWDVKGHVKIKVAWTRGNNAVLSGIFFGVGSGPAKPVITSPLTASGTVNTAFSYTITASNSPTNFFSATGLPAGLSVNTSSGVISGTPTVAGTSNVILTATNSSGTSAPSTLVLTVNPTSVPPTISTQPANQIATAGQTATFSVVAAGTAVLSYQWTKNGTNISGATSFSYTTPATTTSDSGALFAVRVSNSAGSITSNNATLTVNGSTGTTTVVLQDGLNGYSGTRDTYIYQAWPTTNLGAQNTLLFDSVDHVLVRFAIFQSEGGPVPDGASIDSATLALYKSYYYNHTFNAQRVLRNWQESQATWNNANSTTAWSTPGASGSGSDILATVDGQGSVDWNPALLSINVTPGVQSFASGTANYGWELVNAGGNGNTIKFYSREYSADPTLRPKLTVTYHGGTTAPTVAPAIASVSAIPSVLTVSKLQGVVNFAANGRDSVSIQAVIPNLPADFTPAGQTVLLSVNGARASFTLDAKGRGKSAHGSFALKAGHFTAKFQNGTWAGALGLNPDADAANEKLSFEATLWIGGNVYAATVTASCTAKAKVGAKFKK